MSREKQSFYDIAYSFCPILYSGILYDSACIGIVKNIKNKTFTQIKSHGKQYNKKLNGKGNCFSQVIIE